MSHLAAWTPWMVQFMNETLLAGGDGVERGRASCSLAERELGEALSSAWAEWGFETRREAFSCAPLAFLGVIPVSILLWFRALRKYHSSPLAAAAAVGLGFALFVLETVRYREVVDGLGFPFPQQIGARPVPLPAAAQALTPLSGINVVGTLHPADGRTATRRLIVSAHQDRHVPALRSRPSASLTPSRSAYEFNVFWWFGKAAPAVMAATIALQLLMLACALAGVCAAASPLAARLHASAFRPLAVASLLLLPSAVWHVGREVPGAGDNLSGVAVMHAFGAELAAAAAAARGGAEPGVYAYLQPQLQSTEVVLLATSAEEAGLRGAKRFVETNLASLRALPTAVVVLEDTHERAELGVVAHELYPGAVHDRALVRLALSAARRAGLSQVKRLVLPLGGTDATAFTRAGLAALVLTATNLRSLPPQYHTRLDVLESVERGALEDQLRLVLEIAAEVGRGGLERERAAGAAVAGGQDGEL